MEVKTMRIPEAMGVPKPTLRNASHSLSLSGRITADMKLQPSAFAQILASLGLLISAKR